MGRMLMNPKNGEAVSWSEEQKRFYKAFPPAHLEFTPDSLYAQNIVSEAKKPLEVCE